MFRLLAVSLGLVLALSVNQISARDLGQWPDNEVTRWFETLKQPDAPSVSCCGEADAYWCDEIHVKPNGTTTCMITDDRPDEPLRRPHIPMGTEIVIPNHKLKWDRGNPTGHSIVFVSSYEPRSVYCFVQGGGT